MGSSGIEIFLAGFALGIVVVGVALVIVHPSPVVTNCGCGAALEMARQCIQEGNLTAYQCGWFK